MRKHACTGTLEVIANLAQASDGIGLNPAIGIDENDEVGWIVLDVVDRPAQRITLAYPFKVVADDHPGSSPFRDFSGIVRTVIGHDDQTVVLAQLRQDISDRRNDSAAFIVSWNDDGDARLPPGLNERLLTGRPLRGNDFDQQGQSGNAEQSGNRDKPKRNQGRHTKTCDAD